MMTTRPVNLLNLKPDEFEKFLDSFDHVFSDCDGVIWSQQPFPEVGKFFELMEKRGKTVNFVSNNSIRTRENYESKFKAAGISNGFDRLIIPSVAIAEYLKSVNFDKKIYCVTCAETVHILSSYGYKCEEGPDVGVDYYSDYVQYLKDDEAIGAVVFDSDFKVNLPKLYKAVTFLKRPEVLFINGATDRYVPIRKGLLALGVGVFTDLVEKEVKREPILLGKPGKMFGEFAMKKAGITNRKRVLFIGDMIEQDVGLGKEMGFITLLLLTNSTEHNMLSHETIQPDFYADSLGSIVPMLDLK